jgi:phosphopantothenoylcysteine decarboxylase/phosphopantothenate--cysteine ligase
MNCIVTAGPTYEPLDDVRRLTNFSTGRLGTELANFLAARGHKVILLIGTMATHGGERRAQRVETFTTTTDLREKLKAVSSKKVDAIFHAAAVSDFAFGRIFTPNESGKLAEIKSVNKIPTRQGKLLVELVATPKIIAGLRGWFPRTRIGGWKFEAEGARADAISAARQQIAECSTDLCVVNGPAYGEGFGLATRNGKVAHLAGAPLLFEALEKFVRE